MKFAEFQKYAKTPPIYTKPQKLILAVVVTMAVMNFVATLILSDHFGGDALSGFVRDGHYFLGYKGRHFEVNRSVWNLSYYQGISMWCTHMLVFVVVAVFANSNNTKWAWKFLNPRPSA
jgi:hypothetical protein